MRLLLDSHTLIWAVEQPTKLSATAVSALQDPANDLLLSAGTIWEIAIKVSRQKLSLSLPYRQWIESAMADLGLVVVPTTVAHADLLAQLPQHHRDPFDRLLVAQAQVESLHLVSADIQFDPYAITRIW